MKRDSRLSGVLHVLLHMAEGGGHAVTSEALAKVMRTNPVVVRRILSGLREAGWVRSERGHGGGWTVASDLSRISLRDVYDALGEPSLLSIGNRTDAPDCVVEQAVNAALDEAFHAAKELLLQRLGEVSLAALREDFSRRLAKRRDAGSLEAAHG